MKMEMSKIKKTSSFDYDVYLLPSIIQHSIVSFKVCVFRLHFSPLFSLRARQREELEEKEERESVFSEVCVRYEEMSAPTRDSRKIGRHFSGVRGTMKLRSILDYNARIK